MQLKIWRSMTGEQRVQIALDMSEFARALAKTRIRREHPEWTEKQVMFELFRLAFLPQPLPAWVR
ncbi:MAG: hypothetical protein LAP21_22135 [Acidobacteriia bacterium]|nr:hypothetical protein [Terriglobia bacterium]